MTPYERIREVFAFPFELRDYQINEVNDLCPLPRSGYWWEAGCVDSDTEYLTPKGWKKISEYREGAVAQYVQETGAMEFVTPSAYIKQPCETMVRLKTHYGLDQLLSHEHRVLLYRADRPYRSGVMTAGDILSDHDAYLRGERAPRGHSTAKKDTLPITRASIPTVFTAPGGAGIPLSDAELQVQVAVIADGHFNNKSNRCVVRVKRPRKVSRLALLLTCARIPFTRRQQDTPTAKGFYVFTFDAPLRVKEFDSRFWAASRHQLNLMASEVVYWDGSDLPGGRGSGFTSTSKASADFVQYLWAGVGQTARLSEDSRSEKYSNGACYIVTARGGSRGGQRGLLRLHNKTKQTMWEEPSTDGFKYCFSVPSSFLVLRRNGCIFVTGNSGKTSGATHQMLYWNLEFGYRQWFVVVPPILIPQWAIWLRSITDLRTGKPLSVTEYVGTPTQRKALDLNSDFIVLSYGLLKNDFEQLHAFFEDRKLGVLADEAHAVKNIKSDTHKAVALMAEERPLLLLTGTPVNKPGDSYGYMKLVAPSLYRNHRQFEKLHVAERGEYDTVLEWKNLDLLASNMKVNTSRILRREVRSQLPPIVYTTKFYDLDPAHKALYKRITEERLVEFEDGKELDAISAAALRSSLQQIIVNWGFFEGNEGRVPKVLDLIHEVLSEIGENKLVVVANFRRSNAYLLEALAEFQARAIYGDVSAAKKQDALRAFITDPACRVLLVQPQSAGFGIDGLQHVCSDMLIVEAPTTPSPFHQVIARLDRDGQEDVVHCRVAVALGTVQVGMFKSLLANDELANSIQGGYKNLRELVYGEQ